MLQWGSKKGSEENLRETSSDVKGKHSLAGGEKERVSFCLKIQRTGFKSQ